MNKYLREDMNKRKREKRVTSPDNWYPTADDGMVEVSLIHDAKKARWRGRSVECAVLYGMLRTMDETKQMISRCKKLLWRF